MLTPSTAYNGEFNAIAYTEGEISGIIGRGLFCAHKPYFLMPGHI